MCTQNFLLILIYCTIFYVLPAIYVYFMCMLEIIYDDMLMLISSSSVLGSLKLARVLQHGYWQMQQIRAFFPHHLLYFLENQKHAKMLNIFAHH